MDILTLLISRVNDVLWTYILIIMLLGCAFWFTFKTNFVQFRMIREMIRLLGDSTGKTEGREHHISSFQAFAVSIASRVGTGNLAGVATAITLGGPGVRFSGVLGNSSCFWGPAALLLSPHWPNYIKYTDIILSLAGQLIT